MKLRLLLPSVIFLFCGLVSRAQVSEMYYQGFETDETPLFTVTPTSASTYSTTYQMSGSRSLELQQSNTDDVTLLLSPVDFSQNTTLHYIAFQFDHICTVPTNPGGDVAMCRIYYKLERDPETAWQQLTSQHYNRSNGGSSSFVQLGSFSQNSYSEWLNIGLSNEVWMSERFDLNDVMTSSVPADERKLMLKFVMKKKTGSGAATGKWLIDNIKISASPSAMVTPKIKMVHYPELIEHPSSRGARIEMEPTTSLAAGIDPDSVYLYYRVGSDPTPVRIQMTSVTGYAGRYGARIPFYGYDTMMYFYCVARDATTNHNMVTFPAADNAWITYKCVRGVEQPGVETPEFTGTLTASFAFPFSWTACGRSEWIFDSATLAQAGYGPGSMTAMRFTFSSHTNTMNRQRLQLRMKNVPTNYGPDLSNLDEIPFTTSFMHVVYDSAMVINEANAGMTQTMNFQDTFFYAGKDLLMQVLYANPTDMTASPIRMISAPTGKYSIINEEGDAEYGRNPFTTTMMDNATLAENKRPALVMTQRKNLPLLYDMGFDTNRTWASYGLVTPNRDVPMTPGNHSIVVRLKNQGALTTNAIRVSYTIDDTIFGHYDWSGTMAGGTFQTVTINPNVPLPAGFHYLRVWVEDTLTAAGQHYRDHEPYNDTIYSEFVVCEGPMSGVRNIGGPNADFNTMEEFLFAVSRCNIDDSLVVRLAPGIYEPFSMPVVAGLTTAHYIVFEPQGGDVVFRSNGVAPWIVNLESVANIRFRNIRFERLSGAVVDMALLGASSHNCHFEGCVFVDSLSNPAAAMRINSMINTAFSNGLVVDGCTFEGAKVGVDLKGMAEDALSQSNMVRNSLFRNQFDNAVKVENQNNVVVEGNEMYDVLSATSYVLYFNHVYGASRVMANKIYTSHGAGGIGVSNAQGTSEVHMLIANNMLVNADDGNANQMRTLMNIIQANWTDVVYNSLKMTAPSRTGLATATFGGGTLQNSRFVNNIVVCLDNTNYALNYASGYTNGNTIGHNVYYTQGSIMNRRQGVGYGDVENWSTVVTEDTLSISTNPNFLNGSLVDLRTYNRLIKGVGTPISTVPTDMFDTVRSLTATCPGAFEFVSLRYDFEPEALISPEAVTCYMPANVPLKVRLRNSGTMAYGVSGLTISYQVNGGAVASVAVADSVPAEDTVTINTGATLQLPANGFRDSTHIIRVWTSYANDPNQTNDTNIFAVLSKYHPAAPANIDDSVDYAEPATVTPTAGVDTWKVYYHTGAPYRPSTLYWYHDTTDVDPFFVGPSLTTDTLRQDTVFYFRQRRNQAMVRITQLEFKHGGTGTNATVGETPNAPYWLNTGRKVALQLTNVGDSPAYMEGDTLRLLVATANNSGGNVNVKDYVFGNITIEPGASLVVQTVTGNSANPAMTVHTGTPMSTVSVNYNTHAAFIYKHAGVVEDAVAMNSVITTATTKPGNWTQQNVPSWVWTGTVGVNTSTSNRTAGIVRTEIKGTPNDWRIATANDPMMLDATDLSWIEYVDNGCDGLFATAKVSLRSAPLADISLDVPQLPASTCGMGMEEVSVRVHNFGIDTVSGLVLNYCAGGDTVTETVPTTLMANGQLTYTFNGLLNFHFPHDSLVTVKVWANYVAGDPTTSNDTNMASVLALYTPDAPPALPDDTVSYAERDTIMVPFVSGKIPVWYDYDGVAVDTGFTSVSEILYVGGTRGYSYMVTDAYEGIIGTGTTTNGNVAYPAPYQPGNKFAKQQYIYSASELQNAGLKAGYIDSIAFELKQILGTNVNSITFDEYAISMGSTSDSIFNATSATSTSSSDWKDVSQVYRRAPMTISQSDCNTWVAHQFDSPYYWDGESSLVVQILHRIGTACTTGVKSAYTEKNNTTLVKNGNTEPTPSLEEYSGTGTRGKNRPNVRFNNTVYGCSGPITPYNVHLINVPNVDMALLWPRGTDTIQYHSCDSISLYVNVRNQGSSTATNTKLYYYYDDLPVDSTIVQTSIASGVTETVEFLKRPMMPGRHHVTVVVASNGDSITSNDTVSRAFMVRFCGGTYTIAATNGDFHSFGEAIDTLNVAGVEGAVTFNVAAGTYTEQVVLNNIPGSSSANTISFVGTGDEVLLTAATTQANNYVFYLDSASNVSLMNFRIEARPTASGNAGNYGNALVVRSGDNIHVNLCTIRVKGTLDNANASCVVLSGYISNFDFSNNVVDSGYVSLKSSGVCEFSNFSIHHNAFQNFWSQGINLRNVTNIDVLSNEIISGVTKTGHGLTGLYLAQTSGTFNVKKNKVYLIDDKNGGKRGMQFEHINSTSSAAGFVVNNMISCSGTGTQGLSPAKSSGIWIDSSSANVNILFNTIRVYCGSVTAANSDASYSFFSGSTVSNIKVQNNIFSNYSKGYAYFVSELNTVTLSDNNAYYTTGNRPFAWKQTTIGSLRALQTVNHDDANSLFAEPFFVADNDLHLVMTNLVSKADYSPDVTDDIDGTVRMEVPAPTIGAHEMDIHTHDMAVIEVIKPVLPANYNFSINNPPENIEGDSVQVIARFYNNGRSTETNVQWYAYIDGYESSTRSLNKNLGTFSPAEEKTDTLWMPTIYGIINTQTVHVVVELPADSALDNNDRPAPIYLAPAFNLTATKVQPGTTARCALHSTTVKLSIRNDGYKDIQPNTVIKIGYQPEITAPSGTTISTMPGVVEEYIALPSVLYRMGGNTSTIDFTDPANFYPTGTYTNLTIRLRGWVNYDLDVSQENDTTIKNNTAQSTVFYSDYTPDPPTGYDTTFAYGTWGRVRASQNQSLPIRWYRDSTAAPYHAPAQYAASRWWNNTPQYYHDSTYYLNCLGSTAGHCPSPFSEVTVHVENLHACDIAFESVLAPLGGRVYMENDTVRVRIANYGANSQSNIPITYELKRNSTIIQTVTETCTASIAPNGTYDYTFNQLLDIPTPTQNQAYTLRVWTDIPCDEVRRNDTIRTSYSFSSKAESTYTSSTPSAPSFDVTRVSFNEIDLDIPPLGRGNTDLTSYGSSSPEYPTLHLTRGTTDSLILEVTPLDPEARYVRYRAWCFIDFDRSGTFTNDEIVVNGETFYGNEIMKHVANISNNASYGYMRMRIVVGLYSDYDATATPPFDGVPSNKDGHNLDFLLFVDADAPATDIAVDQIVNPRSYLIRDDQPREISFRIANKGTAPVSNPQFEYRFENEAVTPVTGVATFTGTLQPGTSGIVTIPAHAFEMGITNLIISANVDGDENRDNDFLEKEYNRFYVVTLVLDDDFEGINMWYAPTGYNLYSRNYWQRGTPTKSRLNAAYSGENAWVTDLSSNIVTGKRGNVSYLYSPIINISQIRPDTIAFRLRRNLINNSSLQLQFYNYENRWVNVNADSLTNWYNNTDDECFDNTTNGTDYNYYWIPSKKISGDFNERLQFRFVYRTPLTNSSSSAFGEGCAVDDFHIGRARRPVDVGVVAITQPTAPCYGQTIYPEVVVHNYGTDTIRSVKVGYVHYGTNLPKQNTFTCALAPDARDTFLFTSPFIITSDYPDTFQIIAFTEVQQDIYYDNDTASKIFPLSPLDNDIAAHSLLYPLDNVVAGDSLQVTMRVRNFGRSPITHATAVYSVNGYNRVEEDIDFVALLGHALPSMEYYNYTFSHKFRASMGLMKVVASVNSPQNDYIYNDTVSKRVEGINSVTDVAASAIIVDTSSFTEVRFTLVIDNRGARGVNGFEVGFYIDNDTNTTHREIYARGVPLPGLTTGYHRFDFTYPYRSSGYPNVTAFVHVIGDNDSSNDTTKVFANQIIDLEAVKVIVVENAQPDCQVYAQVRNTGNISFLTGAVKCEVTINGKRISHNFMLSNNGIGAGQVKTFHFGDTCVVPKSPTRSYSGTLKITHPSDVFNIENNQTNVIEVRGWMAGAPVVEVSEFTLDQNYPNPFTGITTIPFSLPNDAEVRFFVVDAMGHVVNSFNRHYEAGSHTINIDLSAYPAGVYYYGIEVDGQRRMKKMIMR